MLVFCSIVEYCNLSWIIKEHEVFQIIHIFTVSIKVLLEGHQQRQEHGTLQNIQEHSGTSRNIPEHFGTFWNSNIELYDAQMNTSGVEKVRDQQRKLDTIHHLTFIVRINRPCLCVVHHLMKLAGKKKSLYLLWLIE